jgi:hypothetical protein
MKHRTAVTSVVVMLVATSGCASGIIHSTELAPLDVMTIRPAHSGSSANRVARSELAPLQETSLEAALRQLRPEWLRVNPSSRQGIEPTRASVYINDVYAGELEELRLVPVPAVIDVTYLAPSAARDRFGSGCACAAGAVVVVTRHMK